MFVKGENKGFCLLDLLIVIMIIGIIGVLVTPPIHSMIDGARLNEASGELVSGLQYARSLAVTHQRPFGVLTDTANLEAEGTMQLVSAWLTKYGEELKGLVLAGDGFDKNWYSVDFDTTQTYEGVSIDSVPGAGMISFYPDGHSSSSDSVFVLGYDGDNRTVSVDGATGRIKVN